MSWSPPHVGVGELVLYYGKSLEDTSKYRPMVVTRVNEPVFGGTVVDGPSISYASAGRFPDDPYFDDPANRRIFENEQNAGSGVIRLHPWRLEIERLSSEVRKLEARLRELEGRPKPGRPAKKPVKA